jgi:DNA polymerase V
MDEKSSRGGRRLGAGRKQAYGEPTVPVRMPKRLVPAIQKWLKSHTDRTSLVRNILPGETIAHKASAAYAADASTGAFPLITYSVPAGFPSPAEDMIEGQIDLNQHLVRHPNSTYILRVSGWSMIGAGIHDGDEIVVDRALPARHGNIVVAVVDNQLTVKRLQTNPIRLVAENPEFPDITFTNEKALEIWGIVTRVLHKV